MDQFIDGYPFTFSREVIADSQDTLIVVVGYSRYSFYEPPPRSDEHERQIYIYIHISSFPAGDPV
jgi:hypothetical protein